MTEVLDTPTEQGANAPPSAAHETCARCEPRDAGSRLDRFLSELARMSPRERVRASRYSFNLEERYIYAARYPDEVPTVNGELEWIALNLE